MNATAPTSAARSFHVDKSMELILIGVLWLLFG